MSVGKALISLVIFLIGTAIGWVIGGYLSTIIGDWGIFIGLIIFLITTMYIIDRHDLTEYAIYPVIGIAIAFAWMVGGSLKSLIGDWGIFIGVIILLLEFAGIAYHKGWSFDRT